MVDASRERDRIELIIIQLEAQAASLRDALAVTLSEERRADLFGKVALIEKKIEDYKAKLRPAERRRKGGRVAPPVPRKTQPPKTPAPSSVVEDIQKEFERVTPEIRGELKKSEKDFRRIGYLPSKNFRIDLKKYKCLLRRMLEASGANSKGIALEELVAYLFGSSGPLFSVVLSRKRTRTHEIDHIVMIKPGSFFREWGMFIVVECKNHAKRANVGMVDKLYANLRVARSRAGILFSVAGVTNDGLRSMREAYLREGVVMISVDGADLRAIGDGANLVDLLWQKYLELKFGPSGGRNGGVTE